MSQHEHNLRTYVNRTLTWRILLLSIICSIALMVTFYSLEEARTEKRVVERATIGLNVFVTSRSIFSRNPEPFNEPGLLQYEFDQFVQAASYRSETADKFIFMRIYDNSLNQHSVSYDYAYPDLKTIIPELMPLAEISRQKQLWFEKIQHNDDTLIHIFLPVKGLEADRDSYFEGIFLLSAKTVAETHFGAWRSALIGLLIVIGTTAVIFPVVRKMADRLSLLSQSLLESNLETLQVLGSAIAKKDSDTNAHNYRVTIISVMLAEKIGLPTHNIRALIKGAFLHDVGKIGIADDILLKPGKLDDDEYTIMKTHVNHGIEIVSRSNWLNDASEVVNFHHEQVAGSGYPESLAGDNIPVNARIFAIVDVFDALTASRPYKEPFSFERTMEIINQDTGRHFDRDLVDAFNDIAEDIFHNLANREEGLEEELDSILKKYFPGGKEDLEDAERFQNRKNN